MMNSKYILALKPEFICIQLSIFRAQKVVQPNPHFHVAERCYIDVLCFMHDSKWQ